MPEKEINFFASLLHQYGILNVAMSLVLVSFAMSIPIILSWLKDSMRRKNEKRLLTVLTSLSEEIKMLARQYNESVSMPMVEIIMENFLKHHNWALYDFVREILDKNDIQNQRPEIEERIKMQIYITFKAIDNALVKLKYKTKTLNEFIDRSAWETQINESILKIIYNSKLTCAKKTESVKTYLKTEFGNIHFLVMQDVNKY